MELISRQQAIDAFNTNIDELVVSEKENAEAVEKYLNRVIDEIKQLPPIRPTDNLQKLADEIASFKRHVKSDNSDYLTGYLCALSVVEGMIADMRQKGENNESN